MNELNGHPLIRFTTTRMTQCGAGEEDQARIGLSAFEFPITLDIEKMPPQLSRLCTTGTNDLMVARYLRLSMVQHNVLRKLQLFRLTAQSAILSSEVLVILQTPAILSF
jgi:hypothetical protein